MELLKEITGLLLNITLVALGIGWLIFFYKNVGNKSVIRITEKDIENIVTELEKRERLRKER